VRSQLKRNFGSRDECREVAEHLVESSSFGCQGRERINAIDASDEERRRVSENAGHVPNEIPRCSRPAPGAEVAEVLRRSAQSLLRSVSKGGQEVAKKLLLIVRHRCASVSKGERGQANRSFFTLSKVCGNNKKLQTADVTLYPGPNLRWIVFEHLLAEEVGFEPTVPFPVRRFSRPLP
jgi:hypothetical protein